MTAKVRRRAVRIYARIAAGDHKMPAQQRRLTSAIAKEYVEEEYKGFDAKSLAFCGVTAGLHLPVQYIMQQKQFKHKLFVILKGLAFNVIDAYIANSSQAEGMIPEVAIFIYNKLREHNFSFVANELDKVPLLDDRLSDEELEYVMAMTDILKSLAQAGKEITVQTVATEAKEKLWRMVEENYTMEYANGGGLRQIEYREEMSALCIRTIETDEVVEETKEELERDSRKNTREVTLKPEGHALSIGKMNSVKEVFTLTEKKFKVMSVKTQIRGKWAPIKYLSDLDGSGDQVTARIWYLILNHLTPNRHSFVSSPLALYFRPRTENEANPQSVSIDMKISNKEMACSPLKLTSSVDSYNRIYVHPVGTTISESILSKKIRLVWNGKVQMARES